MFRILIGENSEFNFFLFYYDFYVLIVFILIFMFLWEEIV